VPTLQEWLEDAAPDLHGDPVERATRQQLRARLFDAPSEPESIGRYEVRGRLGQGGIGVVYVGWDPKLRREVAVKLLRDRGVDSSRLRREALALARLSDPHVVEVFEVGTHHGDVFVAMARIEGTTLRRWQEGKTLAQIVAAYRQAARGLAAAHRVGVVHRDFKPDNAMMGSDGRVRLLDFGLASLVETHRDEASLAVTSDGDPAPPTADGQIRGTPGYMPLEQLTGETIDGRADQFAWCASLYEALYGQRPFAGNTLAKYAEAVVNGWMPRESPEAHVPPRLRAVLRRGLAQDRDQRWPAMDALVTALDRAQTRRWRGPLLAATAIVGAAAFFADPRGYASVCAHAGEAVDATWNASQAAALRRRLGPPASESVDAVDEAVEHWRRQAVRSCVTPSGDGLDQLCLTDVRVAIGARAAALRQSDGPLDVGALLDFDTCMDARRRGALPMIDAGDDGDTIAAIRDAIGRTLARGQAGDFAAAAAAIAPAVASARRIEAPALLADALLLSAACASNTGDPATAERDATEAYDVAMAAGHDRLALRAATDLVVLVGHEQRRQGDGERWARAGQALADALADDDLLRARFLVNRGLMRLDFADEAAARTDLETARRIYTTVLGPETAEQIPILGNLAHLALDAGAYDDARALMGRAIELRSALHPEHPELASMLINRALVEIAAERWPAAREDLRRARAHHEALTDSAGSTSAAPLRIAEATLAFETGRLADARAAAEAALALAIEQSGQPHPTAQAARVRLATILVAQGEHDSATALLHRVTSVAADGGEGQDDAQAQAWLELAGVHLQQGRSESASSAMAHVPTEVRDPCMQARIRARLAQIEIATGDPHVTVTALLAAVHDASGCSALVRAEVESTAALAMRRAGMAAERWRPLDTQARSRYEARGGDWVSYTRPRGPNARGRSTDG
jgi:tetratricopeptide (TPR) repeat protein/predicted Ser/Thr protein kinase